MIASETGLSARLIPDCQTPFTRRFYIGLFCICAVMGIAVQYKAVAQSKHNSSRHRGVPPQSKNDVVTATLNGLEFVFDARTGSIIRLSHPATGTMLETVSDSAGIVDLAYPIRDFEPLRLASRYSTNARITKDKGRVIIHWPSLGASRTFVNVPGKVSATVMIKEEADGQSVSMSCKIENHSDSSIPQIIFPDFSGFLPFNGKEGTEFRTGGVAIKPFIDMQVSEHDTFWPFYANSRWFHYGFVLDAKNLVIRWMDLGGRDGGLSIFAKNWGVNSGNREGVMLRLSELTGKLRYMNVLNEVIPADSSWQSADFIITPHEHAWAKGIIPYRAWAKQNVKPRFPLPDHVRDGLGFRTIWMKPSFYSDDARELNFRFKDLPAVAREAKEHGLDEINLWGWYENLWLPLPPPYKQLGREEEFSKAVAECKKIGVNINPFITIMKANAETAKRYGSPGSPSNYMYDPEFIPEMNPRYATAGDATVVPHSSKQWQEDVLASSKYLISLGVPSVSWDQYFSDGTGRYLDTLTDKVRNLSKAHDPQSTFAGEAGTNMENEYDHLDYTWNWDYTDDCDYRALLSVLPAPRINQNIDQSVSAAKIAFADNLYLNVWPRKPDGINGSDYLINHPELSSALKQCARLRKQFLNYFVDGTFVADCILTKDCRDAHVSTYTLPNSMLVIVINTGEPKVIQFEADLQPWIFSPTGKYHVKHFDDGKFIRSSIIPDGRWMNKTPELKNLAIYIYEITTG